MFYFVIDEQAPAGGALHPKAQDVDLAAACGDGADFAVSALSEIEARSFAEGWLGDRMQDFGSGEGFAFSIGPGEVRVQEFAERRWVSLGGGLRTDDRLAEPRIRSGGENERFAQQGEEATKQNSCRKEKVQASGGQ